MPRREVPDRRGHMGEGRAPIEYYQWFAKEFLKRTVCVSVLAASLSASAQSIIPINAGLVSYADEAYIDDQLVEISPIRFFVVNDNAVLRTGAGRAEVLLGPCAAMWIDENSSFRMISSALSNIRIEVLSGSIIVGAGAMVKGTKMALLLKTSVASLNQKGAYRFDAEPPRVQVLAGRTSVKWAKLGFSVRAGRFLPLESLAYVRKFDKLDPDPLDSWSNGRAAYLARLSSEQTGSAQEPAAPVTPTDMDIARTAVRGDPRTNHAQQSLPLSLPPMSNSSRSGCGVAAWRATPR